MAPHERGVFDEKDPPEGLAILRVYNGAGRRIARLEVLSDELDAELEADLRRWLARRDPRLRLHAI